MHSFEHDTDASRTVFGDGTLARVGAEIARMGGRRALVLSTPGPSGLADRVAAELGRAAAGVFDGAEMHTPVEVTEAALARARRRGPTAWSRSAAARRPGSARPCAARTGADQPGGADDLRRLGDHRRSWARPRTARRRPAAVPRSGRRW